MKKNYIAPDTALIKVSLNRTLLAGSLGSDETPNSESLNDAPEVVGRSGNLSRGTIWPQYHSLWED